MSEAKSQKSEAIPDRSPKADENDDTYCERGLDENPKADLKPSDPNSTRFREGRSGNPRGRPRKEPRYPTDTQIFYDIVSTMEQPVTVTRDGKKKKMPAVVAVLDVLLAKGLKGDFRALELLLDNWKSAIRSFARTNAKLEELISQSDVNYSHRTDHEVDKGAVAKEWIRFHNSPPYQAVKMRSNMTMPKRRG